MKRMGIVVVSLFWTMPMWAGQIIYVDDDAALGGDGTSWETAYRYLQDGLNSAAAGAGEIEIRVAQGRYTPNCNEVCPDGSSYSSGNWDCYCLEDCDDRYGNGDRSASFKLAEGVILKGSYAGIIAVDPNVRDVELYETVLSGDLAGDDVAVDPSQFFEDDARLDNSLTIMVVSTGSTLDGVIVTGGHALPYQCSGWANCPDLGPQPRWAAGGLWIDGDEVTVRDCRFYHNYSFQEGGAITIPKRESIIISGCEFMGNGSNDGGGGVGGIASTVMLTDCRFVGNWAMEGGGLHADSSDLALSGCVFSDNNVDYDGGGFCIQGGTALIDNLTVTQNISGRRGGGAAFSSSEINLSMSDFTANQSKYAGAMSGLATNLLVKSCVFQGNSAEIYGGVLSANQMKLINVDSCTWVDNRAAYGTFLSVANTRNSVIIRNCIIQNEGQEINTFDQDMINFSICYSAIAESSVNSLNLVQNIGIIDTDPCFIDPGYWDSNDTPGDPNDDFYVTGDYHLKSQAGRWDSNSESWICDDVTSPCIDKGDPNSPIMHEPFPNGGCINMGAYGGTAEASKSYFGEPVCETIIAGDLNGDGRVNLTDLAILIRNWTE